MFVCVFLIINRKEIFERISFSQLQFLWDLFVQNIRFRYAPCKWLMELSFELLFERQSKILHLYITLILWWYLIHLTTFFMDLMFCFCQQHWQKWKWREHRKITRRRIGIASRRGHFCEKNKIYSIIIKILSNQIIIWRMRKNSYNINF